MTSNKLDINLISREDLYNRYIIQNQDITKISKELGMKSRKTVTKLMKLYNFPIRTKSDMKGELNPRWKGGKSRAYGYKQIHVGSTTIMEHRVVMEKHLGRKLRGDEIVHHIDGNRKNNDIKNLQLMNKIKHDRFEFIKRGGIHPSQEEYYGKPKEKRLSF